MVDLRKGAKAMGQDKSAELEQLLDRPVEPAARIKRLHVIAHMVGTLLSRDPRRRDVMHHLAILDTRRERDGANPEFASALGLLASVMRGFDAERRAIAGNSLGQTVRARLLVALVAGPQFPTELAKAVRSAESVVSRELGKLTADGLVTQAPSDRIRDGRRRPYQITDEGRVEVERMGLIAGPTRTGGWPAGRRPETSGTGTKTEVTAPAQVRAARKMRRLGRPSPEAIRGLIESLGEPMSERDQAETLGEILVCCRNDLDPTTRADAPAFLAELRELAGRTSDPAIDARADYEYARVLMAGIPCGESDDPEQVLTRAQKAAETAGLAEIGGWCLYARAMLCHERGQLAQAAAEAAEAARRFRDGGHSYGETSALLLLGRLGLASGDSATARSAFNRALANARRHHHGPEEAAALLQLGEAELGDDPVGANKRLTAAENAYAVLDDEVNEALAQGAKGVAIFLSDASRDSAAANAAQALLSDSLTRLQRHERGRALTARRLGVLARVTGDPQRARDLLNDAARSYGRLGNPLAQAVALSSLLLTLAQGEPTSSELERTAARILRLLEQTAVDFTGGRETYSLAWVWCLAVCERIASSSSVPSIRARLRTLREHVAGVEVEAPLPDLEAAWIIELAELPRYASAASQ